MTAYDLKEDFFGIYDDHPSSREEAEAAFDAWIREIPDGREFDPFRALARTVQNHREFIFNYWECPSRISNGYTECANRLINETDMRGARLLVRDASGKDPLPQTEPRWTGNGQRERAYRVGLVHDHEDRAPALQFDDGPAQLLFVLVDWRVEDGVAVVVEGACVMRAFAYVEAEPDIDVSGLHVGLPSVGTFRPPRPCRGTVMTPGAGIHITRRPHPRPVAVFLRMGRVPISGRGRPACGGNTPPDHERQGNSAIPHSATGPRGAGPTNQCNGRN